jgi:hypothetical protein
MKKRKPVYEHQDGRGSSVRYVIEKDKRRRARQLAEKLMGKNYFTNMQEIMLESAIELSERKER